MKSSKIITYSLAVTITVLVGVTFVTASDWTAPTGTPPTNNVDAPINVSGSAQEKLGGLILGSGLTTLQTALIVPTGNVGIGVMAPSQKLEVAGNIKLTGSQIYMGNSNNNFYGDSTNLAARMSGDLYIQSADGSTNRDVRANDYFISKTGIWASEIAGSGPTGSAGATGPQGPAGPVGPQGPAGSASTVIVSSTCEVHYIKYADQDLKCSAGYVMTGFRHVGPVGDDWDNKEWITCCKLQ